MTSFQAPKHTTVSQRRTHLTASNSWKLFCRGRCSDPISGLCWPRSILTMKIDTIWSIFLRKKFWLPRNWSNYFSSSEGGVAKCFFGEFFYTPIQTKMISFFISLLATLKKFRNNEIYQKKKKKHMDFKLKRKLSITFKDCVDVDMT